MKIFTTGFARKSAEEFFGLLRLVENLLAPLLSRA